MCGGLIALPAVLHGERAALPFNLVCGVLAGQLRRVAPEREDIWSFSPFIDLSIYRWNRRNLPVPRLFDWQITFLLTIVGLRFLQTEIWRFSSASIFSLESSNLWVESAIYLSAVMVVGTELKIFNTVRIQNKLEEQERFLLQARMVVADQSTLLQHAEFDFFAGTFRSDTVAK